MSIVSTSNRWLNHLYKVIAILLVLLAVAISAFRLLLPYVQHYRVDLQNYLNGKANTHMSIGTLEMEWQDFGPSLIISDVQVIDTEEASVFIKELNLQVDFWQSLTKQNLITKNLILSGAIVDVDQQLTQRQNTEGGNDFVAVTDLFLNRIKRFSILDSQITVRNKPITRNIRINSLRWLNTGERHQGQGSIVLNGLSSNNLQLKLDLYGDTSTALTGQVYLQANHIDITPWLDSLLTIDNDKTKSDINFSAWFGIYESRVGRLNIDFSDSDLHWVEQNKPQKLALKQGQLLLTKGIKEHSFNLQSTELALQLNEQPEQKFFVALAKEIDEFTLHLSDIDVGMIAQLTPLVIAKEKTRNLITTMDLSGKIEDIYIQKRNGKTKALANFFDFTNKFSNRIPGLENVSGSISFADNYLAADFHAVKGELDFDKLFIQPFPYDMLSGQLNANFGDNGWSLAVEKLDFLSKEINLSAKIQVDAPVNGQVNLALLTNVYNGNAGLVGRYLPLPIMKPTLVQYLNDAVVSGRVEDAQVLINGPIRRFPFIDGSGIFVVDAELTNGVFKFANSWPVIKAFDANLNFTNNSMLITGRGGSLTGLDVEGVAAEIKDLKKTRILTVDADIKKTPTAFIGDLMNQSPLQNTVGRTLEYININGDVSGEFHLNLPLKEKHNAVASGTILFNDNQVVLEAPKMKFNQVKGQLSFSNDKIDTNNLQLAWYGLPINLNVKGMKKDNYYNTDIQMSALWQQPQWRKYVPKSLKEYTQGELPWQGELSLHQHHEGGFSYTANIQSNLANTQLLLPTPYETNEASMNQLTVKVDGSSKESNIALTYGEALNFSGKLKHDSVSFSRANLTLGENAMALPHNGFHITTKIDYADTSQWQPFISDILDSIDEFSQGSKDKKREPFIAKPDRIRGSIGQLNFLGQQLSNVSFNFLDKSDWWLLQLNSKETRSQIKIYPDWLKQGIDINAEFLNVTHKKETVLENETTSALEETTLSKITTKEIDKAENDIIFNNMPPMSFHCDSCSVGLLDLGQVDFKVKRESADTITFNDFKAKRGKTELTYDGSWVHNDVESVTALSGKLALEDIEKEIQAFSYESIVKDSGVKAEFAFTWPGGLHDFDMSRVSGTNSARVDDGYLADVSDKAKIFSVLSLQSLVRKLTLDFRDIFSDGMFYSNITGEYELENGLLTTHNTKMNGTAGDLFMTGHTNLVTGELNYDMSYKPDLTSSLPVLAWIATLNPVTFLAGVAIDQVIKSQVVSEFNFKLSGSIENPDFKEVDRKSKSVSIDTKLTNDDSNETSSGDVKITPVNKVIDKQTDKAIESDKPKGKFLEEQAPAND